jgi:hypothetical protein
MGKGKRQKTVKEQKLENDSIMDSRRQLALMLGCAAASWKSGISFQELMMEAHKADTSPETFWMEIADTVGTMIYMVESEG